MGRLRAVYVLSAVFSGLLVMVAALYAVANPRAQLETRLAIHAAALDAFRMPFAASSYTSHKCPVDTLQCRGSCYWARRTLTNRGACQRVCDYSGSSYDYCTARDQA